MTAAKLLSIQVGKVQTLVSTKGKSWESGYAKQRVEGPVFAGRLNLDGDAQKHLAFHGGEHRPILAYSAEHYPVWQQETGKDLAYGSFGENFTVHGLNEDSVCIGDRYAIGPELIVQVSQPRRPCNQIYLFLDIRGIQKKVEVTRRTGWYLRVLQEGMVEAGADIQLLERIQPKWTIRAAHEVYDDPSAMPEAAQALAAIEELEPGWRNKLLRLSQPQ